MIKQPKNTTAKTRSNPSRTAKINAISLTLAISTISSAKSSIILLNDHDIISANSISHTDVIIAGSLIITNLTFNNADHSLSNDWQIRYSDGGENNDRIGFSHSATHSPSTPPLSNVSFSYNLAIASNKQISSLEVYSVGTNQSNGILTLNSDNLPYVTNTTTTPYPSATITLSNPSAIASISNTMFEETQPTSHSTVEMSYSLASVPEPTSTLLLGLGILGFSLRRNRN